MLKDASGNTAADESAYNLIMKEKEKLLSFDSKLKFIFSHSALKEGWDNPNIFQICTLNETNSVIKKRQEIGRGLRICVNQDGERVHGFEVNTLTVMANESYEKFAEQLQREIEQEEGIKFGVVEEHLFANIVVPVDDYTNEYLGVEASKALWNHLKTAGFIDAKGKVQDALKTALKTGELDLPEEFKSRTPQIAAVLKKVSGNLNIKNRDDKKKVSLNKAVFLSEEFKQLWDRIKYRTTFRVDFDVAALTKKCVEEIKANLQVGKARFIYRKAKTKIDRGGVHAQQVQETASVYESRSFELPDLITYLQKSVFDHVVYDSDIELEFAIAFERSDDIKLYAKLPDWFKIDTPLGTYNPDWAVLIEVDGKEKLYFVVETKSTLFTDALRPTEKAKIACGKEHFKALGKEVEFAVTNAFEDFSGKYV